MPSIDIAHLKKQLDDGDFGYCVTCDEEIAPARLDLDPAVTTCISCASGK